MCWKPLVPEWGFASRKASIFFPSNKKSTHSDKMRNMDSFKKMSPCEGLSKKLGNYIN